MSTGVTAIIVLQTQISKCLQWSSPQLSKVHYLEHTSVSLYSVTDSQHYLVLAGSNIKLAMYVEQHFCTGLKFFSQSIQRTLSLNSSLSQHSEWRTVASKFSWFSIFHLQLHFSLGMVLQHSLKRVSLSLTLA